ncbi:MAG TPA: hypothetical protein DHV85_18010, partial [Candidatus Accumulibacter sp.]|nr:hypothetical protein [Accumulibacter sp.]
AMTQITKTEGKKAGAAIPVFSAEISAGETRTFSLSSAAMLKEILPKLEGIPYVPSRGVQVGQRSVVGWVEGDMSVFMVNLRRREPPETHEKVVASEKYFGIHQVDGLKLALLATPEYFTSGLDSFIRLYETVLGAHKLRVRALVRAYPASTDFKEGIVVPLVIIESDERG